MHRLRVTACPCRRPRLAALAGLVILCIPVAARADGGVQCDDCADARPAHLKVAVARCLHLPPGRVADDQGQLLTLGPGTAGAGRSRLWMGMADVTPKPIPHVPRSPAAPHLYLARFAPGAARANACLDLGSLDTFTMDAENGIGATVSAAPGVRIEAYGTGACAHDQDTWLVGDLMLGGGLRLLSSEGGGDVRTQCADADTDKEAAEATAHETAARHHVAALHRQALAAWRHKHLARAEKLLRQALAITRKDVLTDARVPVLNDLGFLLQQRGRAADAERYLVETVLQAPGRAVAWLNLADLYWDAGHRALAAPAYRRYLTTLAAKGTGKAHHARRPVPRAVRRATPVKPPPHAP